MDQHSEIMHSLGSIEGIQQGIVERLDKINGKILAQEIEINRIKEEKAKMYGFTAAISIGLGMAMQFFIK